MSDNYDALKLENQLCFPLYACAKEVVRQYYPHLKALDLTYTQYITMMVFWEHKKINVKELGEKLYLDSGTLSPVLKSLERKGFVRRNRSMADQRVLEVEITAKGEALREKTLEVPLKVSGCVKLDSSEAQTLYGLLYKLLGQIKEQR